jgi:bla regulator protein blaR1
MNTLFVNHFLSDAVVKALCWTLIHSLWQGLLFSLLAAVIITLSKRSSAALRYNLFSGLFALLAITSVITFFSELDFFTQGSALAASVSGGSVETNLLVSGIDEQSYLGRFAAWFNTHSALVVTIWFIIFCIKMAKMLADIGQIQRVKNYKTQQPDEYWRERLQQLAAGLHLGKYIVLLESGLVKVPAVAGFLKPVILVPLGLLTKLPQDQVEAILLHELAHIKRKDYFINLLQSFVETVFFFNPSALWISSLIRVERENCCDDIAINGAANRKSYVTALVSFQENWINNGMGNMAMAFPGTQTSLLDRVKRIIHKENKSLDLFGRIVLLCSLVLVCALPVIFTNRTYAQDIKRQPASSVAGADTTGDKILSTEMSFPDLNRKPTAEEIYLSTITTSDKEKNRYKLVAKGDARPIFYINDQEIQDESILIKHDKLIDGMLRELWKRQGEAEKKRNAARRSNSASN